MRAAAGFAILAGVLFIVGVGAALIFQGHPLKDLFQRPPERVGGDGSRADAWADGLRLPGVLPIPAQSVVLARLRAGLGKNGPRRRAAGLAGWP